MVEDNEYPNPNPEEIEEALTKIELKDLLETQEQKIKKTEATNKIVRLIRDLKFSQNFRADAQEILDFAQVKFNASAFVTESGEIDLLRWVKFIEQEYKTVVKPEKENGDWSEYVIANEIRKKLIELYKYHNTRRGIF